MIRILAVTAAVAVALVGLERPASAQGIIFPGAGATHLSMAGASTAAPVDSLGALYWNPAAISALKQSEVGIGGALISQQIFLGSSLPDGRSGNTQSDSGLGLTSAVGVVYKIADSDLTLGMGMMTLAGGAVNFPGDPGNPILSPKGPFNNVILGPVFASMTAVAIAPTLSYQVTDRIAIGASPMIDVAVPSFNPAYFGTPSRASADAPFEFPAATNNRPFWGGGFRVGILANVVPQLDVGFSYTSPQWFETWQFNTRDASGNPELLKLTANLPAIYSWGLGYRPTDRLLLATDLRYFDWSNAALFGDSIPNPGLAWRSIWAVALGGQYRLTDRAYFRLGYLYNQNPVPNEATLFQAQAPGICEHTVTTGASMDVTDCVTLSLGYAHGFQNSIHGTILEAQGIQSRLSANTNLFMFGLYIKFGPAPKEYETVACASPSGGCGTTVSDTGTPALLPPAGTVKP